jgi:hypothetical protein
LKRAGGDCEKRCKERKGITSYCVPLNIILEGRGWNLTGGTIKRTKKQK